MVARTLPSHNIIWTLVRNNPSLRIVAMNFGFWTLLVIVILQTIVHAKNHGKKIKTFKITYNKHNYGPIKILKIRRQNKFRRNYIITCCGFKKCLANANVTVKKTTPTSSTNSKLRATSTLESTTKAGISSADESSASEPTEAITIESYDSTPSPLDVTEVPTDVPGEVITDLKTDITTKATKTAQYGTKSTSTSTIAAFPSTQVFQKTTAIDAIPSKDGTTSRSSTLSSTTSQAMTKTAPSLTSITTPVMITTMPTVTTVTTSTTLKTTTSTALKTSTSPMTTTTTTPIPRTLSCVAYNTFLASNPTPGALQTKGTKKTSNCGLEYFVSTSTATRNEAAIQCKALNMTLLTVTSLEGLECVNNFEANTFWTSGSNEDDQLYLAKKYAWCSTGFDMSKEIIESEKLWLPPKNTIPSATERCLAVSISTVSSKQGLVQRKCDDALPFICQYSVDCPKLCNRNNSLFDSSGLLKDKKSYGIWFDIGAYTYLLGNKPMTWVDSYRQCCALGMEALNIDNAAEQLGLTAMTGRANKDNWTANFNYWTSGSWKGAPENQWSWCEPNGPTVFAKGLVWESPQPDNKGGNESCVHFRFTLNSTGTIMTDRNCANKFIFACKSALQTTPKPCVASCPTESCEINNNLFVTEPDTNAKTLRDYFSYGNWYDGCGRNFLTYTSILADWIAARGHCCDIGLTLASMESVGKSSCFSRIVSKFAPATFGDYWLSGTDLGCDSNFRWCTLGRDLVNPEVKWKVGHPKPGLDCVYLEVRNGSELLATDDCAQKKSFLCEVRKKATFQRAMQSECADIWDITVDQIDLLLNVSAFLTTTITLNLKCFLKCVGVEIGLFGVGGLDALATLRQIELVSQEDPVELETGFVAYDQCSGINSDDECVIAYETYKCGQQKAPDLVSKIITNHYDNDTMLYPPTPCVYSRRSCWLSKNLPCVKNQTAIDLLYKNRCAST
ncbi:uncharacterized protein LOC135944512 isoform X2 [Cloeon dipterum]|uniref:uncharacterized protein LOC135944512 isoform X2 n=1 Tax=Cloeon dipterum TaxID=197152 RepID=UPI00321FF38F